MDYFNEYPVMLTAEDLKNNTGIEARDLKGNDPVLALKNFIDTIHSHVYDLLIYPTGSVSIKNRVIEKYRVELEKPIKRALIKQAKYLIESDNIELWNGVVRNSEAVSSTPTSDILQKIICPSLYNILMGAEPNILYAGG